MNDFIKGKIIENEKKLLDAFPEYKQSICQLIKKVEKANYDGVLYEIIESSFKTDNKIQQIKKYNIKGFTSSLEILEMNKDMLDLNDKPKLCNLVEGNQYNQYDICCMAKNYNNQVGMYFVDENNIIIKSTVEDNNRPYDDRWLKKDIVLKYFMQREKEENLKTLIFSNRPNVTIFNALMEGRMINIHTFINTKSGDNYKYYGIFHPCGLVSNNKSFILFKDGYDYEVPFDNLDAQFVSSLLKDNMYPDLDTINLIAVEYVENKCEAFNVERIRPSKRNAVQQLKINIEVDLRGEELVLHYERNKLIKMGYPNLAELVSNDSLYDSSLGYDIRSYDVQHDGTVKEIFIKIKSSVSSRINKFSLTKQELENISYNPDKYKLYRVFDIYTDKPKFYTVECPLNTIYNIQPASFDLMAK